jgi:tetratricopeptide (TPR) repeat protein
MRSLLILLFVCAAYSLACFIKLNAFWQAPGFEKDQRTLFWTESAMHFYMADKVARGESLGTLDTKAQSPEGIQLNRDIAPAMPWIAGDLYKWLSPQMPLDIFISYLFVFFSSLTVVAVFLWVNALFLPKGAVAFTAYLPGLLAAFLYAVSGPSFVRSVGAYIKEDLALPSLMLGFVFFFLSLRTESSRGAVIAALFVSLALLSWHFSQFMLLCFSASLILSLMVNGLFTRAQAKALALFTLILAITSLAFPVLRATAFVCSPAMAIFYAIITFHFTKGLEQTRRQALTSLVFILSILIYFKSGLAEQSHVFRLIIDKLQFGLIKPEDPTLLSYETRSVWIEDFNSPGLNFLLYTVSFFLPFGLAGLIVILKQAWQQKRALGTAAREKLFVASFGFIFLFFFIVARRMITIEIIFLCVAISALLQIGPRWSRWSLSALLVGVLLFEGWKSYSYFEPNPVRQAVNHYFPGGDLPEVFTVAEHNDVLHWIRSFVNPEHPILASIGFSPVILAYTGRPIVIHSMFDAKEMRDKVEVYLKALYSDEDTFYQYVQKNRAQVFIYESRHMLMNGPNSDRYVAGEMQPSKDSAVYKFHFRPESLKHFRLVYQNIAYRIFTVDPKIPSVRMLPQPIYDERLLVDDRNTELILFLQGARNLIFQGFQYGGAGNVPTAIQYWEEVKRQAPYAVDIHAQLCLGYLITKNIKEATANCTTQVELQPHSPTGHYHMALLYEQTARYPQAIQELESALLIDPRMKKAADRLKALSTSSPQ